ncbi:MAG: response regulator transcription factor [Lachnospiraceae bacterium]|nr:response regulator transcription factor [Lachnospiraceae bacterium]
MAYHVLVVEDQEMPRQLFEIFINSSENYTHVGSVANAGLALSMCRNQKVDLILMDVMTELGHSGLEAAAEVKQTFPHIKIIIVTSMPEYSWLERAREIGVESFWYKDGKKNAILDVMDRTMEGESVYPDNTPLIRIGNSTNHEFTERELDILRELTTGDSNTEIGERLSISASTVKYHVQNLLDKTGFKTRTELAAKARSLGIVIK